MKAVYLSFLPCSTFILSSYSKPERAREVGEVLAPFLVHERFVNNLGFLYRGGGFFKVKRGGFEGAGVGGACTSGYGVIIQARVMLENH